MTDEIPWKLTNEICFVPRVDGGRYVRILQQKRERPDAVEWIDVPFVEDDE